MIEVIVTTLREAKEAEQYGANRLELIADMQSGGITPSFGTIRNVVEHVSIPVHVMIRPHAHSFVYSEDDKETILADIGLCRELGADAIVFGALTADGQVDEGLLGEVIKHKGEMSLTFHRAIDEAKDIMQAVEVLNDFPEIERILTSGGAQTASEGINQLEKMHQHTSIELLAGAGITAENVHLFVERLGASFVHIGNGVRTNGQLDQKKFKQVLSQMKR